MISAFYNALSGLGAASRSFAGTAHNIAHYGAVGRLSQGPASPVAPPSDAGPFRLFDTASHTVESGGVATVQVERVPSSVAVYAPHSPLANQEGLVAVANVDFAAETVDSIRSRTLFLANLRSMGAADEMLGALLDSKA